MSSKPNKSKVTKGSKPAKVNNEPHKAKDTKPPMMTTRKPNKKIIKQPIKPKQPTSNQKLVETNNNDLIHTKKRSSTVKRPHLKENVNNPTINKSKTNTPKKPRSKSVDTIPHHITKSPTTKKTHIPKPNPTKNRTTLIKSLSDNRFEPTEKPILTKTKTQPNIDSINPKTPPILRTKARNPDTKTQEGRKKIAKETMKILYGPNSGKYVLFKTNETVDLTDQISHCVKNTETIINVRYDTYEFPSEVETNCTIEVTPESSFAAARRLSHTYKTAVLNSSSAIKPGGNFLSGKMAQEETLSRQSALFKSLQKEKFMYMHHKANRSDLRYSDYMIFSPSVPVFRDDKTEKLLNENDVFLTDVISAVAPNKAEMVKKGQNIKSLHALLLSRCEKILRCAIDHGDNAIVIGAFGCGVFGNDPKEVSQIFKELLLQKGYKKYFAAVVFAIVDKTSKNFIEFKKTFR